MLQPKFEQDGTTKAHRIPNSLLDYIQNQSLNDDFVSLLTKHHKSLETLLSRKTQPPEVKDALFIVELNSFNADLIKAARLCAEINLKTCTPYRGIEMNREAFQNHDAKELAEIIGSFYRDARNYDSNYPVRQLLPKFDGRPFSMDLVLLFNPFCHNPDLSNEENICNLIAEFNVHAVFFKNFLNTLYGDGNEGLEFFGRTFESVSADYEKILSKIAEISTLIPKSTPERLQGNVESKMDALKQMLEIYPATLYLATKIILNHLENSTTTSLNSSP